MKTPATPLMSSIMPWGVMLGDSTMSSAPEVKSGVRIKKTMTSVDLMAWLKEKAPLLRTSRINNLYRVEDSENIFVAKLHTREGRKFLVMEPSARIHFTEYSLRFPSMPDGLTMAFRRHVKGYIIREVRQVGFDRIMEILLSNDKKMFLELIPRGVMVVVGTDGRILVSNEYREMRDRVLLPGKQYALPPHYEKAPSLEECIQLASQNIKLLSKNSGLPPEIVREAVSRAGSDYENAHRICENIYEILDESGRGKGYVAYSLTSGEPVFFSPYYPHHIEELSRTQGMELAIKEHSSFNDALDMFFSHGLSKRIESRVSEKVEEKMGKLSSRLERERVLVEQYEKDSEKLYDRAKRLLEYRHLLEQVIECANRARKDEGWENVARKCKGVVKALPERGEIVVNLPDGNLVTVKINEPLKSQIEEMFSQAKKLRRKADSARKHLAELERKLVKERERVEKEKGMILRSLRKKEWYENYWWSITRKGRIVIAGKDASQNEALVRKYLRENDIFLHADIHGAPATILKTEGNESPSEEELSDAAVIAACYSKSWKAGLGAIDVFWVRGSQVSKTPPSGEYLAKGSFMVYGKKNYIKNVPLTLAVGLQEGETVRFMVGSLESVRSNGTPLAIIVPGDAEKEKVARKIAETAWKKGKHTPPPSELSLLLPGKARIVKLF